jgi:WD40 repeat protein
MKYLDPVPGSVFARIVLISGLLFGFCLVLARAEPPRFSERPIPVEEPPMFVGRPIDLQGARAGAIVALAISPDEQTLATAVMGNHEQSGEIKLWSVAKRKPIASYPESGMAGAIGYSPDGRLLAYAMGDSTVKVRDCTRGATVAVLRGHRSNVTTLFFTPDNRTLITVGGGQAKRWETATFQELPGIKEPVQNAALFPDGKRLLICAADLAKVWDLAADKELVVLRGHKQAVFHVAVSADAQTLATGGVDQSIKFWDAKTGQLLDSIDTRAPVTLLRFAPDGKTLASVRSDGVVQFWDVATMQELGFQERHKKQVSGLIFTRDGKTLVTSSADRSIKLWDVTTRKEIATIRDPADNGDERPMVLAVACSPDGTTFVTGGDGKEIHVWDRAKRELKATLRGHEDVVAGLAFAPDGKTLASASYDQTLRLWDIADGHWPRAPRLTLRGHTNWVFCATFAPDGRTLASGGYDRTIRFWDVASGKERSVFKGHSAGVRSVVFSADGKTLASGSADRTVRLWNAGTGLETARWKGHSGGVRAVRFGPDDTTLASAAEDGKVIIWNVADGKEVHTLNNGANSPRDEEAMSAAEVWALEFTPRGASLVSAGIGAIKVWDPISGALLSSLAGHTDRVTSLAIPPDGTELLSGSYDRTAKLWPRSNPRWVARRTVASQGSFAALAPDGVTLACSNGDGIRLYPTSLGRLLGPLRGSNSAAHALTFSVDGKQVVVAHDDHSIKILDVASRRVVRSLVGHEVPVRSTAISPDGRMLVSCGGQGGSRADEPGEIKVWDLSTGLEVRSLTGHNGTIFRAAYSPDGKWIASAGQDATIKIWNAATGKDLHTLRGHTKAVRHVTFSADGKYLASAGFDGDLHVWDTATWTRQRTLHVDKRTFVCASFTPDGRRMVACQNDVRWQDGPPFDDGEIVVWEWESNRVQFTLKGHKAAVECVTVSPDGRWIVSGDGSATIKIWDADIGREVAQMFPSQVGDVNCLAFAPDGRTLVSAGAVANGGAMIHRWEIASEAKRIHLAGLSAPPTSAIYSPDGKLLAAVGTDRAVRLWDVATGTVRHALRGHAKEVRHVVFSADGSMLATAGDDLTIGLWDPKTGLEKKILRGHSRAVCGLAFSVDGAILASCSGDAKDGTLPGEVKMWDTASGKERYTVPGEPRQVRSLAFSPDGRWLVGREHGGSVHVWEAATGIERTLLQSSSPIRAFAFMPGNRLVTGHTDGTTRLWDTVTWKEKETLQEVNRVGSPVALRAVPPGSAPPPVRLVTVAIVSVVISTGAHTAATMREDGTVVLWDIPRDVPAAVRQR